MEDVWPRGVELGLLANVFPLGESAPAAALEDDDEGDESTNEDDNDDGQEPGLAVSAEYLRLLK